MGHDKARSPLHHGGKRFLNPNFRARIYGGGRLIQNQHRGQAEHHSGNTKELFLSLGKASAVLPDHRIIPLGKSLDKTVGMGRFRGGDYFFLRGVRPAHHDIIPDRPGFQPCFLQYHPVIFTQAPSRHFPDICAVHTDFPFVHVIKPHQQIDHRRFSTARRTHNSHSLARLHRQVQIRNQLFIRHIGKVHMG